MYLLCISKCTSGVSRSSRQAICQKERCDGQDWIRRVPAQGANQGTVFLLRNITSQCKIYKSELHNHQQKSSCCKFIKASLACNKSWEYIYIMKWKKTWDSARAFCETIQAHSFHSFLKHIINIHKRFIYLHFREKTISSSHRLHHSSSRWEITLARSA